MTMKELFELLNWFYKNKTKSTFYYCIKSSCNETELIIKRERLYCVYWNFKDQSRRIYFDSVNKLSFQSIEKKIIEKFSIVINILTTYNAFATLTQCIKNLKFLKNDQKIKIHNDWDSLNENDFNLRKRFDNRVKNTRKRTKQRDELNNKNCHNNIICLF